MVDWWVSCLVGGLVCWRVDGFMGKWAGGFVGWMISQCWLVRQSAGCLVDWWVCCSVCWLGACLVGWWVRRLEFLVF